MGVNGRHFDHHVIKEKQHCVLVVFFMFCWQKSASEKQQDKSINASMIRAVMEPVIEEIEGNSETLRIQAENDQIDRDMVRGNGKAENMNELSLSLKNVIMSLIQCGW